MVQANLGHEVYFKRLYKLSLNLPMLTMHAHKNVFKNNIMVVKSSTEQDVPKKELSMPLDFQPLCCVLRAHMLIGKQDPALSSA